MSEYRVVVEQTADCFCAYTPDLPGCLATGASEEEVRERMDNVIRVHLRGLQKAGLEPPKP